MLCTTAINTIRTKRLSDRSLSSTGLRLLPCDAMLARYMLTPCVRPSVRLSHVAVLLKGINLRLRNPFLHFLAQAASMQPTKLDISNLVCRLNVKSTAIIQGRPKSGPFLRVGNFATIQKVVLCGCGVVCGAWSLDEGWHSWAAGLVLHLQNFQACIYSHLRKKT